MCDMKLVHGVSRCQSIVVPERVMIDPRAASGPVDLRITSWYPMTWTSGLEQMMRFADEIFLFASMSSSSSAMHTWAVACDGCMVYERPGRRCRVHRPALGHACAALARQGLSAEVITAGPVYPLMEVCLFVCLLVALRPINI
jgi:hypothetical protein